MNTSGGGELQALLYALMLMCSAWAGLALLAVASPRRLARRPPVAAVGLWLVVAVPSLIQLTFPQLLGWLGRQPAMIRDDGQVWRLVTSAVVEDGGLAGTLFNLAVLAVIAVIAVRIWGAATALAIFVAGVVGFNVMATYVSPSAGAGSSGGTFMLAASVTGLAAVVIRRPLFAVLAAGTIADGVMLLALRDAHGEVVLAGLLVGALLGVSSSHLPQVPVFRGGTGPLPGPDLRSNRALIDLLEPVDPDGKE
jgi:membrane associated rhomboid family serine protease